MSVKIKLVDISLLLLGEASISGTKMKTINFDIETAQLIVASETGQIVTRYGAPVNITCWDGTLKLPGVGIPKRPQNDFPIIGQVFMGYLGHPVTHCWTKDGKFVLALPEAKVESSLDLFIRVDDDSIANLLGDDNTIF